MDNLKIAYDTGYKAGEALNQGDSARCSFFINWFNRFKRLEMNYSTKELQTQFDLGYMAARKEV